MKILFLVEHNANKTDIIKHYLLSHSTVLKLYNLKYLDVSI